MPEYEEREAARFFGIQFGDWLANERSERVSAVAHYRLTRLTDRHVGDAVHRDSRQKQRAARR